MILKNTATQDLALRARYMADQEILTRSYGDTRELMARVLILAHNDTGGVEWKLDIWIVVYHD